MEIIKVNCKTTFLKNSVDKDVANFLYNYLIENIEWEEGIRSKKGFTRKAKAIIPGNIPEIDQIIDHVLNKITTTKYGIISYYLNYYENGEMWTPNHTHKDTHQLVISLGASRNLSVRNKNYLMENGDSIIFGSAVHGVPKDVSVKEGRISIATFMVPIKIN